MIIVLRPETTPAQLEHVLERIQQLGFKPHVSQGEHRTIIGVIGDENKIQAEPLQAIPGVEQVLAVMKPFKLASREFHKKDTVIPVGKVKVGGGYLAMIAGKTAAIVQFAAWAGALVGGANDASAAAWRTFGLDLGLGFQIRDDLLGIWGTAAETGKAPADDIRRRKKSFPLVLLQERLATAERQELAHRLAEPVVEAETVDHVLQLLDRTNVRAAVEAEIALHHDRARAALFIASPTPNPYRDRLLDLVETLSRRRK